LGGYLALTRLRIGFLDTQLVTGGVTVWTSKAVEGLAHKNNVSLITLAPAHSDIYSHEPIDTSGAVRRIRVPAIWLPIAEGRPIFASISRLSDALQKLDVVYVAVPRIPFDLTLWAIGKCVTRPLIAGFHGNVRSDGIFRKLYAHPFMSSLKMYSGYHVFSAAGEAWLAEQGLGPIYRIPPGIEPERFELCNNPTSSNLFKVLFVGRLSEEKGVELLTEIIDRVNRTKMSSSIKFAIVGTGEMTGNVVQSTRKHANVEFKGFVPHEQIIQEYANSNLLLVPSKWETWGIGLIEAQTCGLPAVASSTVGVTEILKKKTTGRLVQPGDVEGFVEAIESYHRLWHDSRAAYFELNKSVRSATVRRFDSWVNVIDRLQQMFEECSR
jgi:glycosyltransferase involved in cell wall biosynthesis